MTAAQLLRLGPSRLAVNIQTAGEVVVGIFQGHADETGIPTLVDASEALVTHPLPRVALDLRSLAHASPWCLQALAGTIAEAHRLGKEVALIRCPEWLFRELRRRGTAGEVRHVGSLAAATDGLLGDPGRMLAMSLRSSAQLLPRVQHALAAFFAGLQLPPDVAAVRETIAGMCRHAVEHRSPRGLRNRVQVLVHVEPDAVVADIIDECDPPKAEPPASWDDCVEQARRSVDYLEVLPDLGGTVWRLTRRLTEA